jgi:hypothetical protein
MSLRRSLFAIAFLPMGVAGAFAQALPTTQPKILTIIREQIKVGHDAAHVLTESAWPAAYSAIKSPDVYLALTSMTGPGEVWFLSPRESYTAWAKSMARDEANTALSATLDKAWVADAAHLDGTNMIEAVAVPELSHGTYPDLNHTRFWEITIWRVRPGHEDRFAEAAKTYGAIATRGAPGMAWRVYMVTAGMVGPTYLIFSSVQSFGDLDKAMATGDAMMKSATPAEMAILNKFSLESSVSTLTNRYRLDPKMSYVSAETKAMDPAFWNKK